MYHTCQRLCKRFFAKKCPAVNDGAFSLGSTSISLEIEPNGQADVAGTICATRDEERRLFGSGRILIEIDIFRSVAEYGHIEDIAEFDRRTQSEPIVELPLARDGKVKDIK